MYERIIGNFLFKGSSGSKKDRKRITEIYNVVNAYDFNEFKKIAISLSINKTLKNGRELYVIPSNFNSSYLKAHFKSSQTKYEDSRTFLNTTFTFSYFIFTDVTYKRNEIGSAVLSSQDKERIDAIISKLSKFSFTKLEQYFKSNPSFLSIRNNKLVIPKDIHFNFFSDLEDKKESKDSSNGNKENKNKENQVNVEEHFLPGINATIINNEKLLVSDYSDLKNINLNNEMQQLKNQSKKKLFNKKIGNHTPARMSISTQRIQRLSSIVLFLKRLYDNTCQICGERLEVAFEQYYSEVHHIQPLGLHRGADVVENMIVLCPNHHTMFDRGSITIFLNEKRIIHKNSIHQINRKKLLFKHSIDQKYIDYHNTYIFGNDNLSTSNKIKQVEAARQQELNYGKMIRIQDIHNSETFDVQLEVFHQREFMTNFQLALVNVIEGDSVNINSHTYIVIEINK